ncbi:MAG: colanic acid biosynthesis glycosyltransferase WcaL, partial [Cyanobacteria bacterium J06555_12]
MKIVHVVEEFPVPSETFVLNQIAGALDRGHDVEILALQGAADPELSVHPIVEQYQLLSRTRFSPRVPANY